MKSRESDLLEEDEKAFLPTFFVLYRALNLDPVSEC
jgi:hypothetical protein